MEAFITTFPYITHKTHDMEFKYLGKLTSPSLRTLKNCESFFFFWPEDEKIKLCIIVPIFILVDATAFLVHLDCFIYLKQNELILLFKCLTYNNYGGCRLFI